MFQENVLKQIKTYFMFNIFFSENRTVYEVMWKNTERFLAIRLQAPADSIFRI